MWQDEEEPQWGAEPEEVKPEETPADAAPAEGAPAPEEEKVLSFEEQLAADAKPGTETLKLFRHWVRPKFLQYNYLYDYRRNYYDDVIDFMDRRSHGITRDIPKPQTWAERVLRTYTRKPTASAIKRTSDTDLIHDIHHIQAIHHMHSRDYYNRKFTIAF